MASDRPLVLITGAAGNLGQALAEALSDAYRVVGLDLKGGRGDFPLIEADMTSDESVEAALGQVRERFGGRIASVLHLAAYFDFTGEAHPLYEKLNVEGTRRLLRALQGFEVEQLVYSGTILVHAPCRPGERIDEDQPIAPKWAYPKSKAAAEAVIREEHGAIPYVLLHLAGVYDETSAVPTLSQQIARIYERDVQSYLYSGDPSVGQSMLHRADMIDAFRRTVDRRGQLPPEAVILVGEPDAMGYGELQDELGRLIHGEENWATLKVAKPLAKAGAWAQEKLEPVIPDAIDQGRAPFVRPFMVEMADDHYALDVRRAEALLGWRPRHDLRSTLPKLVEALKADPAGWYKANAVPPPPWLAEAKQEALDPEALRSRHEARFGREHEEGRWAQFVNIALGAWLAASPPLVGLEDARLAASEVVCGLLVMALSALALARGLWIARWGAAAVGLWVLFAPLLFWTPSAAAYLNDTLVGGLIIAFAVCLKPEPGPSPIAALEGPATPPGWSYNPSDWTQRLPIIALAVVGLLISRYLTAYQLGHIEGVWEPFFAGGPDPQNGTEEIITSSVSEAWPVPDAGVGALTYLLEIVTGVIGTRRRWRTMPWLVLLFGLMIAPLGVVSITFIVIQPIVIGTWCTLCLIAAAAMLVQIPYSLDELLATIQFLRRRRRAGHSLLRVLLVGDTDEGAEPPRPDEFSRPVRQVMADMVGGGVSLPWNLALAALIGVWLMFTRLTLGAEGGMADADHLIGALVLTVVAIACAEVARPARLLIAPLGAALLVTPFVFGAGAAAMIASLVCGLALIGLAAPRGRIVGRYGGWNRRLV
ncbi:vitamin K epoxide reductase family protein [Phenylobacterium terrae]|uniref:Vitamin K epoxide reductase family protein n=1 Tax=Phenylobacterium terrae TaxID=2665495 RepID=A0ABW4N3N7_9CAUL